MLANTKQVRAVLKSFNIRANYTDKVVRKKGYNRSTNKTRIVMAAMYTQPTTFNAKVAAVKQKFAELGYTNKVYTTDECYLRIKTFLA